MTTHGEILSQVMSETGTTQQELSRRSGVKQPSISKYVSGQIAMSDDMANRLLSCMGYQLEVVRRPIKVNLDRSHLRSWRLHCELSRHLVDEIVTSWSPIMRINVERLRLSTQGQPHQRNLQRWLELIDRGDVAGIRRAMTGLDIDSVQMREVSPMGGLLPENERSSVLAGLHR